MGKRDEGKRGAEAFELYYSTLYQDRWDRLKAAMLGSHDQVDHGAGLLEPYRLDRASVFAASCFSPLNAGAWLDMCAAPGGKTLILSGFLAGDSVLTANERSPERKRRLHAVLDRHVPPEIRPKIRVTGCDAAAMCRRERDAYDRILLDAPCSSERHVMLSPKHLADWTPARPKHLAHAQWALLSCAFLLLKPGGELVYSTCSINPAENDGVVRRLFEKYSDAAALRECPPFPGAEPTEFGTMVFPDSCSGSGPMYVSALKKLV